MKIEIQSDSSTANSLTDRFGARQRTKHIDTRYFWIQERVQDGDVSIRKVATAKNCADVGTKKQSLLQYYNNIASLQDWYSTDHGSHPPLLDEGAADQESKAQKQTVVNVDREHRDGCASWVKLVNGGRV